MLTLQGEISSDSIYLSNYSQCMYLSLDKNYLYKKIYDEVTEDILIDMSNVRILKKEIEKKNG